MPLAASLLDFERAPKKAKNVSVAEVLLVEAKMLRINVSKAAEAGIAKAVFEKQAKRWLNENQEALQSSNEYVEKNGLPLARHRMF